MKTKRENSIKNNRELDDTVKLGALFLSFNVLTIYGALFFMRQPLELIINIIPGGEMTIGIAYLLLFSLGILLYIVGKTIITMRLPEFAGCSLEHYRILCHHTLLILGFF